MDISSFSSKLLVPKFGTANSIPKITFKLLKVMLGDCGKERKLGVPFFGGFAEGFVPRFFSKESVSKALVDTWGEFRDIPTLVEIIWRKCNSLPTSPPRN